MIQYMIFFTICALVFMIVSILIGKGYTNLIHDYHMFNIKEEDKKEYGKAVSKAFAVIAASCFVSGIVGLFNFLRVAVAVIFIGILTALVILIKAQKKYNGGLF